LIADLNCRSIATKMKGFKTLFAGIIFWRIILNS
jgi:hypothetical protein